MCWICTVGLFLIRFWQKSWTECCEFMFFWESENILVDERYFSIKTVNIVLSRWIFQKARFPLQQTFDSNIWFIDLIIPWGYCSCPQPADHQQAFCWCHRLCAQCNHQSWGDKLPKTGRITYRLHATRYTHVHCCIIESLIAFPLWTSLFPTNTFNDIFKSFQEAWLPSRLLSNQAALSNTKQFDMSVKKPCCIWVRSTPCWS